MKAATSSMQLTRAADYGVRVMIHLISVGESRRLSLRTLAESTGAPESFLSKVLQALTRGDLLVSQRGQAGGFALSTRGREASMRDVIEAVDGPIYLNLCVRSGNSCIRKAWCPAHPVWERAQQAMVDVLDGARIEDLALGSTPAVVPSIDSSAERENITAAERDQPRCGECNQSTHPD
jgi:Rrf2 family protein